MVWIACTNPAQSMPDQAAVRAGLGARGARRAAGSVRRHRDRGVRRRAAARDDVGREGRHGHQFRAPHLARARGGAPARRGARRLADRRRLRAAARSAPAAAYLARAARCFPTRRRREIFDEHATTTRGRDLDITGLSHDVLDARGPQQWPCRRGRRDGTARLYTDGVFPTADGRARFAAVPYAPVAERVDARYPLRLNTGRLRDQWHGMSRTGTVAQLFAHTARAAARDAPARHRAARPRRRRSRARRIAARRDHRAGRARATNRARAGRSCRCTGEAPRSAATGCTASTR